MGHEKETKHAVARRYPRVPLAKGMLVAWQCSDGKGVSRVATLGLGGLFISAPDPPPVGTLIKLLFDVPDGEVRARAVVKNIKAGAGMAVAFVDMGYSDRARLNQLLKRLLH
jgi:PilZ domain